MGNLRRNTEAFYRKWHHYKWFKGLPGILGKEDIIIIHKGKLIDIYGRTFTTKMGKVYKVKFSDKDAIESAENLQKKNKGLIVAGNMDGDILFISRISPAIHRAVKSINAGKFSRETERVKSGDGFNKNFTGHQRSGDKTFI